MPKTCIESSKKSEERWVCISNFESQASWHLKRGQTVVRLIFGQLFNSLSIFSSLYFAMLFPEFGNLSNES